MIAPAAWSRATDHLVRMLRSRRPDLGAHATVQACIAACFDCAQACRACGTACRDLLAAMP